MMTPNTDTEDAADSLDNSPEEQGEDSQSSTFYLPSDFLKGKKYQAGDTITLKVLGEDQDGDTEVALSTDGGDSSNWRDDLKQSMAAPSGEGQ